MTQIMRNGISFSRLLNPDTHSPFIDLIKCKICFNILLNPYDCNVCGNSFCLNCINHFVDNQLPCPFKCQHFSIKPSSFGITSYLSKLEFACLNKQNGCKELIPYASVLDHEKECKYFYTTCPNIQCSKTMKWTLIENHLQNECEFSLFKCPLCDMEFGLKEHSDHVSNCSKVRASLQYTSNKKQQQNNNKDGQSDAEGDIDINKLIQSLPQLNEMSLASFIKILLYQINQSNKGLSGKFDALQNEMLKMKEESEQSCRNSMVFFENINNELESLNTKLEFIEINDTIKQSINESIQNTETKHQQLHINSIDDYKSNHINSSTSSNISDALRTSNNKIALITNKPQSQKNSSGLDQIKEVVVSSDNKKKRGKRQINVLKYEKKSNGYSPKPYPSHNKNANSNNSTLTPNKSDDNSISGDTIHNNKFNHPIARPFNTFSNFTNSNLITIINNQELIINQLNALSLKIEVNMQKNNDMIKKQLSFPESIIKEETKHEGGDFNEEVNSIQAINKPDDVMIHDIKINDDASDSNNIDVVDDNNNINKDKVYKENN